MQFSARGAAELGDKRHILKLIENGVFHFPARLKFHEPLGVGNTYSFDLFDNYLI